MQVLRRQFVCRVGRIIIRHPRRSLQFRSSDLSPASCCCCLCRPGSQPGRGEMWLELDIYYILPPHSGELSGWQSGLGGEEARVSDVISNKAYIDLVNTSQPTITIPRALRLLPRHYSQTNIWNNAEHTSSPT